MPAADVPATADGPKVSFTASQSSALEPGDAIVLDIAVVDFQLDGAKIGGPAEPGIGHYHVYWDNDPGADPIAVGADPTVTVNVPEDTSDGSHQLRVVLHNNDHTPLDPPVEAMQWILVYRL